VRELLVAKTAIGALGENPSRWRAGRAGVLGTRAEAEVRDRRNPEVRDRRNPKVRDRRNPKVRDRRNPKVPTASRCQPYAVSATVVKSERRSCHSSSADDTPPHGHGRGVMMGA